MCAVFLLVATHVFRFPIAGAASSTDSALAGIVAPDPPWEFLPVDRHARGAVRQRIGTDGSLDLSAETFARFPSGVSRRRPRDTSRSLARTITVRPESATIVYSGDTSRVRETFFVPVKEARRRDFARHRDRATARNRSALRSRFSAGMACGNRRNVHRMGQESARVRARRRNAQVCRTRRFADRCGSRNGTSRRTISILRQTRSGLASPNKGKRPEAAS